MFSCALYNIYYKLQTRNGYDKQGSLSEFRNVPDTHYKYKEKEGLDFVFLYI